jgi:F-type H+-transporting ATPase subunit c
MKDLIVVAPAFAVMPAAIGAAWAMSHISRSAIDGMTRQPEMGGQLFTAMLIGNALVEALVIYCLVIALMLAGKI